MQPFRLDKKLLEKVIKKAGASHQVEAAQICDACNRILPEINKKSTDHAKAFSYKNKVLVILVSNSIWASEIQMSSHKIMEEINEEFKQDLVSRIQFKVAG